MVEKLQDYNTPTDSTNNPTSKGSSSQKTRGRTGSLVPKRRHQRSSWNQIEATLAGKAAALFMGQIISTEKKKAFLFVGTSHHIHTTNFFQG